MTSGDDAKIKFVFKDRPYSFLQYNFRLQFITRIQYVRIEKRSRSLNDLIWCELSAIRLDGCELVV